MPIFRRGELVTPIGEPAIAFGDQWTEHQVVVHPGPPAFPIMSFAWKRIYLPVQHIGAPAGQVRARVERRVISIEEHPSRPQLPKQFGVQPPDFGAAQPVQGSSRHDSVELAAGGPGPSVATQVSLDHEDLGIERPVDGQKCRVKINSDDLGVGPDREDPFGQGTGTAGEIQDTKRPVRLDGADQGGQIAEPFLPIGEITLLLPIPRFQPSLGFGSGKAGH